MKRSDTGRDHARVAAIMSGTVLPGVGQFYNNQRIKGVILAALDLIMLVVILLIVISVIIEHAFDHLTAVGLQINPFFERLAAMNGLLKFLIPLYISNRVFSVWDAYRFAPKEADENVPLAKKAE